MMLEVLQYATSGFWVFVGCAILLGIAVKGIVLLVALIVRK